MSSKKVAVILYLFYTDTWELYRELLLKHKNIKLFLVLNNDNVNQHVIEDCKKHFKQSKILLTSNKGLDILPFLSTLDSIDSDVYPFFIKLHSKKSIIFNDDDTNLWNSVLLHSVLGDKDILQNNISNLESNTNNAACCLETFIINNNERQHTYKIQELCRVLKIDYNKCKNTPMMTGGVFMGKTSYFKHFFTKKNIEIIKNYVEGGRVNGNVPTYTHALECILSYFITNKNDLIINTHVIYEDIYNTQLKSNLSLFKTFNNFCFIKQNPMINGKITNNTKDKLCITWSNIYDKREQIYIKKNNIFERVDIEESNEGFNVVQYKLLNKDLIKLSDDEAEIHYFSHGKSENRIHSLETISRVFNAGFYCKKYNTEPSNALQEYIKKGRFENRIYNPIIEDSFDYGEYICNLNLKDKNIKLNQYDALFEYQNNKQKHIECIKKLNINSSLNASPQNTVCIYVVNISSKADIAFALQDINYLQQTCKEIIVFTNCTNFLYKIKDKQLLSYYREINDYKWLYECYNEGLGNTKIKDNNVLLLTNKTVIINDIKQLLVSCEQSNSDFVFLTCEYRKHIYDENINFKVHQNFIFFNKKQIKTFKTFLNKILKTQATYTLYDYIEFELVKYLVKNKKTIKCVLRPKDFKLLLYNELCHLNISNQPDFLYTHKIPIINKSNLYYFNNLIPQCFIKINKKSLRLTQWLNTQIPKKQIHKKICAVINVFTVFNITEFTDYINSLYERCSNLIVYITGNKEAYELLRKNNSKILYFETANKGMDIGPFLKLLHHLKTTDEEYDYIIKIQEKRTDHWRKYMINNLIENLYHYCLLLEEDRVSLTAPFRYILQLDDLNKLTIDYITQRYNIPFDYKFEQTYNGFVGGTMFIIKHKTFNNFIEQYNINLDYELSLLEEGAVTNEFATYTHAWERILSCVLPTVMKTELKCI